MVCLGTVGFALSVAVVVLEFDSACWAVRDAQCLCSCEYLFSELFVFFCACSAHRVSSSLLFVRVRWWRVAASARRAPPPSNTTLFPLLLLVFLVFLVFFVCGKGVWCVVRAQLCEHARNTPHALCVLWVCLLRAVCVASTTLWCLLSPPHIVRC